MAEKRYYWLKLNEDYFESPKIKKLRKIAGGDTLTIIYLKMQLLSIRNRGIITFEGIEKDFVDELALKLDEDVENIQLLLVYLQAQGLIEQSDTDFLLLEACKKIGSENESAERVRKFREKQKLDVEALQCNASVTEVKRSSISVSSSNYNIDNETPIKGGKGGKESKHKYGEYKNVLLTDSQLQKLNADFGEETTKEAIQYLSEYIQMKGAKYKDHNLVLRKWGIKAVEEKRSNINKQENKSKMFNILEQAFEDNNYEN